MKKVVDSVRKTIVTNAKGTPFAWYNMELNRIEILHGRIFTILQLDWDVFPTVVPWQRRYSSLPEEPIWDMYDHRIVASRVYGDEQMGMDLIVIRHSTHITCLAIPPGAVIHKKYIPCR